MSGPYKPEHTNQDGHPYVNGPESNYYSSGGTALECNTYAEAEQLAKQLNKAWGHGHAARGQMIREALGITR